MFLTHFLANGPPKKWLVGKAVCGGARSAVMVTCGIWTWGWSGTQPWGAAQGRTRYRDYSYDSQLMCRGPLVSCEFHRWATKFLSACYVSLCYSWGSSLLGSLSRGVLGYECSSHGGGGQAGNKRCHLGSCYKESNVDGLNSLHKYSLKLDFGQCCGGQANCVWSDVGPYALIFG